jgi:hypothetical protein
MSDATATTSSDQSSPSIEMKPVRSSKKSMKTKKQSGSEDQAPGASEASSQTDDNGEVSVNLAFQQLDVRIFTDIWFTDSLAKTEKQKPQ